MNATLTTKHQFTARFAVQALALTTLLALTIVGLMNAPMFELVRYLGWMGLHYALAEQVVLAILMGADVASLALIVGVGLAGAIARIGFKVIINYVRMHGVQRAVAW